MGISDVLILGGGVIGLAAARELRRRGIRNIRLLDKGEIGRESSWAAAGMLAPQVEADADNAFFRKCLESNRLYPALADELADETGIDIELAKSGLLYVTFNEKERSELAGRLAWQAAAGLGVQHLDRSEIRELEPGISNAVVDALLFPDDGQVENRRLVNALTEYAARNGIEMRPGETVRSVINGPDSVRVETDHGGYHAAAAVVATGAWTSFIEFGSIETPVKVKPVRGQMICYRPDVLPERVICSHAGYIVPRRDGRLLAGATVEHAGFDKTTTDQGIAEMQHAAIKILPALAGYDVNDSWAGLRPYVDGGEPYVGRLSENGRVVAAVGHYRNGILLAPLTARSIADSIVDVLDRTSK